MVASERELETLQPREDVSDNIINGVISMELNSLAQSENFYLAHAAWVSYRVTEDQTGSVDKFDRYPTNAKGKLRGIYPVHYTSDAYSLTTQ